MAEKFPYLFAPRRFVFGMVEVPQWGYDWGYPMAYIELMCTDTTIMKNERKKNKEHYTVADRDEAIRKWKEQKAKRGEVKISLNEEILKNTLNE